jgi:2-amino-1-hydroxyethylphosphonate dioxygenase (glycine-forming)
MILQQMGIRTNPYTINYIYSTVYALTSIIYPILFYKNKITVNEYLLLCPISVMYGLFDILFVYKNKLENIRQTILHHSILIVFTSKLYMGYYTNESINISIYNYLTEITTPTLNLILYLSKNKLNIKYKMLFKSTLFITCVNFFIFRVLNGIYISYRIYNTIYKLEMYLQFILTSMNFYWFYKLLKYKNRKINMITSENDRIIKNINKVFDLYENYGTSNYIGEDMTQVEHAKQAAFLASQNYMCNKPDIILGAFLHDIGHLLVFENKHIEKMGDLGAKDHEIVGSNFLSSLGFPERICKIVANHINTKRYLISLNSEYYDELSEASKKTFEYQGGKMTEKEMKDFKLDENFRIHLYIRKFDDLAKDNSEETKAKMNSINYYRQMAIELMVGSN